MEKLSLSLANQARGFVGWCWLTAGPEEYLGTIPNNDWSPISRFARAISEHVLACRSSTAKRSVSLFGGIIHRLGRLRLSNPGLTPYFSVAQGWHTCPCSGLSRSASNFAAATFATHSRQIEQTLLEEVRMRMNFESRDSSTMKSVVTNYPMWMQCHCLGLDQLAVRELNAPLERSRALADAPKGMDVDPRYSRASLAYICAAGRPLVLT
jgi:hypothetical protein